MTNSGVTLDLTNALTSTIKTIQVHMLAAKKIAATDILHKIQGFYKGIRFISSMLKSALAEKEKA